MKAKDLSKRRKCTFMIRAALLSPEITNRQQFLASPHLGARRADRTRVRMGLGQLRLAGSVGRCGARADGGRGLSEFGC